MDGRSQTQMASDQYQKDRDEAREEIKKLKEENEELNSTILARDEELGDIEKNVFTGYDEDIKKLKEENEELRQFHEWDKIAALKWNDEKEKNEKSKEENEKLKEEKDVLQKFLAGNFDYADEVKAMISRDWTKEFIENNEERWGEIGLEGVF